MIKEVKSLFFKETVVLEDNTILTLDEDSGRFAKIDITYLDIEEVPQLPSQILLQRIARRNK